MTPPADPNPTCWTVVRAAASGDVLARATFTQDYQVFLREFFQARWHGRRLDSEVADAVQEVFVECLKPGGVLTRAESSKGDFRGLLFGVCRNVARRFEKRAAASLGRQSNDSELLRGLSADQAGQATLFDRSWANEMVRRARKLHQLRAEEEGEEGLRRVELLKRRFGDDQAIREIAVDWGVEARQVHNAYRRARTDFHGCLCTIIAQYAPEGADLELECRRLLEALK